MRHATNREGLRTCLLCGVGAVLIAAIVTIPALSGAATVTAGTCRNKAFATIQAAVNAAHSRDTVQLCPGSQPEQVTITKQLTVTGITVANQDAAVIVTPVGGLQANTADVLTVLPEGAQVLV
jgi:hypothetical protein